MAEQSKVATEASKPRTPGGIGFDVDCGMRLVHIDLTWPEIEPVLPQLVDLLAARGPAGVPAGRLGERDRYGESCRPTAWWQSPHVASSRP